MTEVSKSLIEQYTVSPDVVRKRADIIIENLTSGIKPVSNPKVVILGGQPGSGKGELTTQALIKISRNSVICNADDYRDLHPKIKEIKELQPQYYPDLTSKFAQDCNNLLRQHCEEYHLNYILETTFSSGKRMNDTIREMRSRGYDVSMMLLAVHHNLSFLGTKLRYESMFAQSGFGRTVSKKQHDERYDLIISTLKQCWMQNYIKTFIFTDAQVVNDCLEPQ
jgi:predicted ABC-type ATPase